MPIKKYRSVEEMPSLAWCDALHRYRSIEEASQAREAWELRDVAPSG